MNWLWASLGWTESRQIELELQTSKCLLTQSYPSDGVRERRAAGRTEPLDNLCSYSPTSKKFLYYVLFRVHFTSTSSDRNGHLQKVIVTVIDVEKLTFFFFFFFLQSAGLVLGSGTLANLKGEKSCLKRNLN